MHIVAGFCYRRACTLNVRTDPQPACSVMSRKRLGSRLFASSIALAILLSVIPSGDSAIAKAVASRSTGLTALSVSDDSVALGWDDAGDDSATGNQMMRRSAGGDRYGDGLYADCISEGDIYEGGHRVPLLMRWPAVIESGTTIDATVSLTDIYATLTSILGEEPASSVAPDSVSLLPLALGQAVSRGVPVVHYSSSGMVALRDGRWKLVFREEEDTENDSAHQNPSETPSDEPFWLYDLEGRNGEWTDVIRSHPDVVSRMAAALESIRSAEYDNLSGDATLKSLRIAGIDIPNFDSGKHSYTAHAHTHIETVRVTAIPTSADAVAIVTTPDGERLYDILLYGRYGHGQANMRLSETDDTSIQVAVTSPDKSATTTYTVTIERNYETTGAPRVIGKNSVGEKLTADVSNVADGDGLENAVFTYQWIIGDGRIESEIEGAVEATYTLTAEDVGKLLKVRVTFEDDAGMKEVLTSDAVNLSVKLHANLSARRSTDIVPPESGFSTYSSSSGTLSPNRFVLDGSTYTIQFLAYAREGLWRGFTPHFRWTSRCRLEMRPISEVKARSLHPPSEQGDSGGQRSIRTGSKAVPLV